ncbi:MAG: VPLPA-CTERM sorting domain-containing protein [Pikeienuella sp.]
MIRLSIVAVAATAVAAPAQAAVAFRVSFTVEGGDLILIEEGQRLPPFPRFDRGLTDPTVDPLAGPAQITAPILGSFLVSTTDLDQSDGSGRFEILDSTLSFPTLDYEFFNEPFGGGSYRQSPAQPVEAQRLSVNDINPAPDPLFDGAGVSFVNYSIVAPETTINPDVFDIDVLLADLLDADFAFTATAQVLTEDQEILAQVFYGINNATITEISAAPEGVVPLPAGIWLMLSGLAALGLVRHSFRAKASA